MSLLTLTLSYKMEAFSAEIRLSISTLEMIFVQYAESGTAKRPAEDALVYPCVPHAYHRTTAFHVVIYRTVITVSPLEYIPQDPQNVP